MEEQPQLPPSPQKDFISNEINNTTSLSTSNATTREEEEMIQQMELEVRLGSRLINAESQLKPFRKKRKISPSKFPLIQYKKRNVRWTIFLVSNLCQNHDTSLYKNK